MMILNLQNKMFHGLVAAYCFVILDRLLRLELRMPSYGSTQRERSQSETPKDSALKFPEVSRPLNKHGAFLKRSVLSDTHAAAFTRRGDWFIRGQDWKKYTFHRIRQEQGADGEEDTL